MKMKNAFPRAGDEPMKPVLPVLLSQTVAGAG
jgi:hypothetical protein